MFSMHRLLLFPALFAAALLPGVELLTNRDFSKSADGVPTGWKYQKNRTSPEYRLHPAGPEGPASVEITTSATTGQGLLMFRSWRKCPAGTLLIVTGEYRSSDLAFGKDGKILVSLQGAFSQMPKAPKTWLTGAPKPAESWTKFRYSGRLKYPVEYLQFNLGLVAAKGSLRLRNLSVDALLPSSEPDPSEAFVWREAEDVEKVRPVSTWGRELGGEYYSGRGGVFLEKGKLDWSFQIPAVTDPVSLLEKKRTWYLWARIYGYLDSPRIMIYRNGRFMAFVDTPANEKADKQGNYLGPGQYLWVLCGEFTAAGGMQQLSFQPRGRMLADAFLLTTDRRYAPVRFEAKKMKQEPVQDISARNVIRAEYAEEGVSDTVTLPLSFRGGGKALKIADGAPPAVFHLSLPAGIEVKGVSSHWAGKDWNTPERWGTKFLTWKKVGSRTVRGKTVHDYEAYLHYLSEHQYLIFLKATPEAFRAGGESCCEYWLENGGEKQQKEKVVLKHIAIRPTAPFRRIRIGPSYVPFKMLYFSWPDVFDNMSACGLNYIGFWGEPWKWGEPFDAFRRRAYERDFMLTAVVRQYTGAKKEHLAVGLDGKPVSGRRVLTLAMTEKDAPVGETLERTRLCAAAGVNVEYDDEMTNVLWDRIDYSPAVKKLFREWLAENSPGVAYREPEEIVRDRLADPEMYRRWVDFKCSRIAYWYSLYRKAFDEGTARASGKRPAGMAPMMMTCVQGLLVGRDGKPCGAEAIKEAGCLDYRLLGRYCDIIQMMSYTYQGVRESAVPGDKIELYDAYTGRNNTAAVLLAGGYGTEIAPENKVMLKYQVWECLMQKPKIIVFYAGATLFNAPTVAPVAEAVRVARPYEDFFTEGERYAGAKSLSGRVRLKALKLGGKVLLYAANYDNRIGPAETVSFPAAPKAVTDCASGGSLPVAGNGFSFDFKADRGRLFLVEF